MSDPRPTEIKLRTRSRVLEIAFDDGARFVALFVLVYCVVFGVGVLYIRRLLQKGPTPAAHGPDQSLPNRPLSAAQRATRESLAQGHVS